MNDVPVHEARVLFNPPTEDYRWFPRGPTPASFAGEQGIMWLSAQPGPRAPFGAVHFLGLDGEPPRSHHESVLWMRTGFVAPTTRKDTLLVGVESLDKVIVGTLEWSTGRVRCLSPFGQWDSRSMISAACVLPDGSGVVFGTRDVACREPGAGLYLYTAEDNRVTRLFGGQTCTAGKVIQAGSGR